MAKIPGFIKELNKKFEGNVSPEFLLATVRQEARKFDAGDRTSKIRDRAHCNQVACWYRCQPDRWKPKETESLKTTSVYVVVTPLAE